VLVAEATAWDTKHTEGTKEKLRKNKKSEEL